MRGYDTYGQAMGPASQAEKDRIADRVKREDEERARNSAGWPDCAAAPCPSDVRRRAEGANGSRRDGSRRGQSRGSCQRTRST